MTSSQVTDSDSSADITDGFLILGGQDTASYISNNVQFSFAPDANNYLSVAIQSITSNTNGKSATLLDGVIQVLVDSTIAEMWLPQSACNAFRDAFGLTFSPTNKLYLINDTAHDTNLKNNPTVSIKIANIPTASESVTISFQYKAFAQPYYDTNNPSYSKRYFPIRLATDPIQFTLGRVFLQEAVLTVDHERKNFSISQVVDLRGVNPQIVNIQSPSASATPVPVPVPQGGGGFPIGAIAGIVVALVLVLLGILGWFFWRRQRQNKDQKRGYDSTGSTDPDAIGPLQLPVASLSPPAEKSRPHEMHTPQSKGGTDYFGSHVAISRPPHRPQMSNLSNGSNELEGCRSPAPAYGSVPLAGLPPAELPGALPIQELHSRHVSTTSVSNFRLASSPPIQSPMSEFVPSPDEHGSAVPTANTGWDSSTLVNHNHHDNESIPQSAARIALSPVRGAHIKDLKSPNSNNTNNTNNDTTQRYHSFENTSEMTATSGPLHPDPLSSQNLSSIFSHPISGLGLINALPTTTTTTTTQPPLQIHHQPIIPHQIPLSAAPISSREPREHSESLPRHSDSLRSRTSDTSPIVSAVTGTGTGTSVFSGFVSGMTSTVQSPVGTMVPPSSFIPPGAGVGAGGGTGSGTGSGIGIARRPVKER